MAKSFTNTIEQPEMLTLKEGVMEFEFEGKLAPLMENADAFYQEGVLSYEEKNFYTCWLDALNDFSWDADPNDPKNKDAAARKLNLSLKLVKLMQENEKLPEDFRRLCAELIAEYVA